jgi:hypothetical protein
VGLEVLGRRDCLGEGEGWDAAAAGLMALGFLKSDGRAAGLIELGLPMSEGAALGLTPSG